MQKLTFIDSGNNIFKIAYLKPYRLVSLTGISDIPVVLQSEKGYMQDGSTPSVETLESRIITVAVMIFGVNSEDIYKKRRELIRFFNIKKGEFTIIYQNDYITKQIKGRIMQTPVVGALEDESSGLQKVVFAFESNDPYWQDIDVSIKELALRMNMLEFPAEFPADGIEFGLVTNKRLQIENDGDVKTPVKIEWIGNVVNPQVKNETTGEYVRVKTTILTGEKLTIITDYGKKSVIKTDVYGNQINAFGLIDLSSKFFSLMPGTNIISYDADSGADESTLFIYYKNRFIGV